MSHPCSLYFSLVIVFLAVFCIFYIEITKNSKINYSKKNFSYVKEKLLIEINKCKNNEKNWLSNISCEEYDWLDKCDGKDSLIEGSFVTSIIIIISSTWVKDFLSNLCF